MLEELVRRARSDSAFFHQLVFKPEEVLGTLDFLGRREKGMILTIAAEDVIAGLAGLVVNPGGGVGECDNSCYETCKCTDSTCGGCTDTCNVTCDATCANTVQGGFTGDVVTDQLRTALGGKRSLFRPVQRPTAQE
jgi:hypothetical protein